ncbi:MAG: hypothetical protein M1825_005727 [Sarcosagium campestre]|nr:MAG: hypothetical protein M1825_005727 [Sarcosagium campestre]
MSMRIVPSRNHPTSHQPVTSSFAVPSLPDRLDPSPAQAAGDAIPTPTSNHPLESRLLRYTATMNAMKAESLRRHFGLAEPVRRGMEQKIVDAGEWRPQCLGGSAGVHGDILRGEDCSIEGGWDGIFSGGELRREFGIHEELERRWRVRW